MSTRISLLAAFLLSLSSALLSPLAYATSAEANTLGTVGAQQATSQAGPDNSTYQVSSTTSGNITQPASELNTNVSRKSQVSINCSQAAFGAATQSAVVGLATECKTTGAGKYVIRFCMNSQNGGVCDDAKPNDGWATQAFTPNNTYTVNQNIKMAVGDCTSGTCTIDVTKSGSLSTTTATIGADGQKAESKQYADNNSVTSSTLGTGVYTNQGQTILPGKNANSGYYVGDIVSNGGSIASCFDRQQSQIASGQDTYTCSGNASVNFGQQNCANTQSCLKWATTTKTWTQTCDSTVNLGADSCRTVVPTQQCTLSNVKKTETCSDSFTPKVAVTDSCTPGTWIYSSRKSAGAITGGWNSDYCQAAVQCTPNSKTLHFQYWCWGGNPPHDKFNAYTGLSLSGAMTPAIGHTSSTETCVTINKNRDRCWYPTVYSCPSGYSPIQPFKSTGGMCISGGEFLGNTNPSWNGSTLSVPWYLANGNCNTTTNQCSWNFAIGYVGGLTFNFTYPHKVITVQSTSENNQCAQYE